MSLLRSTIASAVSFVAILSATAQLSAASPRTEPDPAVTHANRIGRTHFSEAFVTIDGVRLHYVEVGKGPLIILYHGFPSTWLSFIDVMTDLSDRFRVVALDAQGAGLSDQPQDPAAYRVPVLAAQLDKFARKIGGKKPFVLAGHDWGSALSLAYAQAYPHRLRAVIGMNAPPYADFLTLVWDDPEQQARSQYMQRFRALDQSSIETLGLPETVWRTSYGDLIARKVLSPERGELLRSALSKPATLNAAMNWYRANIPPFDQLGAETGWPRDPKPVTIPAVMLWGTRDTAFVAAAPDRFRHYAPRGCVIRLEGIGHWTPIEAPQQVGAAIRSVATTGTCPEEQAAGGTP